MANVDRSFLVFARSDRWTRAAGEGLPRTRTNASPANYLSASSLIFGSTVSQIDAATGTISSPFGIARKSPWIDRQRCVRIVA
jgi:hypothetical protein